MTDLAMKVEVSQQLPKAATGIQGLDEITGGGLPAGRPTLVCGSAGCGKTMVEITGISAERALRRTLRDLITIQSPNEGQKKEEKHPDLPRRRALEGENSYRKAARCASAWPSCSQARGLTAGVSAHSPRTAEALKWGLHSPFSWMALKSLSR